MALALDEPPARAAAASRRRETADRRATFTRSMSEMLDVGVVVASVRAGPRIARILRLHQDQVGVSQRFTGPL